MSRPKSAKPAVIPIAEEVPVIRPEPPCAEPEPQFPKEWDSEFRTAANAARTAYGEWENRYKESRAAALVSGQRLAELHRASDRRKMGFVFVLAALQISPRTAAEHERYAQHYPRAKELIGGIGGDVEDWSISQVVGLGTGKLSIEDYEPDGTKKQPPKKSRAELLHEKIERAKQELAELAEQEPPHAPEPDGPKVRDGYGEPVTLGEMLRRIYGAEQLAQWAGQPETVRVVAGAEIKIGDQMLRADRPILIVPQGGGE